MREGETAMPATTGHSDGAIPKAPHAAHPALRISPSRSSPMLAIDGTT